MPATTSLPFGLRDIKLTALDAAGAVSGTAVDLPNAQTMTFEESEDYTTLRGDDKNVASRGQGASVKWSLEAGGINLDAYAILNGGIVTTSGTGSTAKDSYTKLDTDARPRFKAEGQSLSESGGDFHTVLYNCKTDGKISGEQADGAFWITKADGTAIGAVSTGKLYDFVRNSTTAAIV